MNTTPSPATTVRRLRAVALVLALAGGASLAPQAFADPLGPAGQGRMTAHVADHRGPHGGGHMRSDAHHGRGMDHMLTRIGVTDEQRAQIEQITRAARDEARAGREAGMALREQMAALMAQPSIDAGAVEALRQQMVARHDEASQRRTQTMLEVAQVLTPEQRAQVAAHVQARAERMKARRDAGERGAR